MLQLVDLDGNFQSQIWLIIFIRNAEITKMANVMLENNV